MNNKDLNEDELTAIVDEHPFYPLAQWWLLLHYKKTQHKSYNKQAAVTSMFFYNQKWLNWQLAKQDTINETAVKPAPLPVTGIAGLSPAAAVVLEKKIEEPIAFEPLYTVDYFASQGIKISEEAVASDKLGTQLKSFTEWLKSMKKLHAEKPAASDEQTDKNIRHIAESSNASINVITEAMAEVLLRQGKTEQAIEIYNKLSLNFPAGSAYFADKIHHLKTV